MRRLLKKLFLPNSHAIAASSDMAGYPSGLVRSYVKQAQKTQAVLQDFLGSVDSESEFISLGENCSTAWYLKQVGLKKASYPFDWIFSSPEIVLDCVEDGFEKYLDRSYLKPKDNGSSAGHDYYHSNFFNHKNPLESEECYNYYKRCCQRFNHSLKSHHSSYYLLTLVNEPSKRPSWANGFTKQFSMPLDRDYNSIEPLVNKLRFLKNNSKFVVVDHRTNCGGAIETEKVDSDCMIVRFDAIGESTGVFYRNNLDDFCFKVVMTGMYGS